METNDQLNAGEKFNEIQNIINDLERDKEEIVQIWEKKVKIVDDWISVIFATIEWDTISKVLKVTKRVPIKWPRSIEIFNQKDKSTLTFYGNLSENLRIDYRIGSELEIEKKRRTYFYLKGWETLELSQETINALEKSTLDDVQEFMRRCVDALPPINDKNSSELIEIFKLQ